MDIYVIRITNYDSIVEIAVEPSSESIYESLPLLNHVSVGKKQTILGISITISDDCKSFNTSSASWTLLEPNDDGVLPISDNTIVTDQDDASHLLMRLSDTLPLPGSHMLNIIYDFRGRDLLDSPIGVGIAGAITKLCAWHRGHLEVYTDCELSKYHISLFSGMDGNFQIHECEVDNNAKCVLSDRQFWRGQLALQGDLDLHVLAGFTLVTSYNPVNEPIIVNAVNDREVHNSSGARAIWIGHEIRVVAPIDVTTVPSTYYHGRTFELHYRVDSRHPDRNITVQSMYDTLSSGPNATYLCQMHYSTSDQPYAPNPKLSSTHWCQFVMGTSQLPGFQNCVVTPNLSNLYFLLTLPQNNSNITNNIIKFICLVLRKKEEINWNELADKALATEHTECNDYENISDTPALGWPPVNLMPLLRRYTFFKSRMNTVLTEWIDNHEAGASISTPELFSVISNSLQHIHAEITKSWRRCAEILEPFSIHVDNEVTASSIMYDSQMSMLQRFEDAAKLCVENITKVTSEKSAAPLDMHLAPDDILQHFLPGGECKNGFTILKENAENHPFPSEAVLGNFNESMKLNYHGILYNIDELESEKYERACRRLLEKCVKFETRSLGSIERVPSHCIMPVQDSPMKGDFCEGVGVQNSQFKKRHLKKVAEKLHQRRIQKRKSCSQITNHQASSMTLRSTPKKLLKCVSESNLPPKEQKRQLRKTYVQDNKKRLEKLVASTLIDHGVQLKSKRFESCSRRLYNVCMAFLRDLKSSKNLDKIMQETVSKNVQSVLSFDV